MIAFLNAAVVLGFPAGAIWAVRTGGRRRLWLVVGACLVVMTGGALASASPRFGNRLAGQQRCGSRGGEPPQARPA